MRIHAIQDYRVFLSSVSCIGVGIGIYIIIENYIIILGWFRSILQLYLLICGKQGFHL